MEEYRDLDLTVTALREVLDEEEFLPLPAGVVLQAYLPDSHRVQRDLTDWALERGARGGAPIKLRIVKGANLAMERIEGELHGWPQAPYATKPEVDANYVRMLEYGCRRDRARAVHLGIATHNLFDVAYGLLLREDEGVEPWVEFEMLEGMANHQARAVQARAGALLLYAPVVRAEDFASAIAYLVRRLDENTAEDNFLRHVFDLEPDSPAWARERDRFLAALDLVDRVSDAPRRTQNRAAESRAEDPPAADPAAPFTNEPDTDWSIAANRHWIAGVMDRWRDRPPETVPLQIGGELLPGAAEAEGRDRSRPERLAYRHALADRAAVSRALDATRAAQPAWAGRPHAERRALLDRRGGGARSAARRPDRRDDRRRRQDRGRGRPRGLGGDRLRALLRARARPGGRSARVPDGAARRRGRGAALELPAVHPRGRRARRARRGQWRHPQARARGRAGRLASRPGPVGRRNSQGGARLPAVSRRRRGPRAHHRPARGRRHPHRLGRDGAPLPGVATGPHALRRDQRQERDHRHGARGSRSGHPRSRPLGLRPRRPEVLGGEPGHLRGRGVRGRGVPPPAPRCRREPPRRRRLGSRRAASPR